MHFFSFLALNLFIPYSKKQILPGMKSLHCADVAVCDHFIDYGMASLVSVLKKLGFRIVWKFTNRPQFNRNHSGWVGVHGWRIWRTQ